MSLHLSGFTVPIAATVLALAALQWLVFAAASWVTRAAKPKQGMRGAERRLLVSSGVVAAAFLAVFGATLLPPSSAKLASTAATPARHGSCARVAAGMPEAEVTNVAGKPDQVRADEEARGPGAAIWIYRDSRCAVHLFDGKVEFVE